MPGGTHHLASLMAEVRWSLVGHGVLGAVRAEQNRRAQVCIKEFPRDVHV
jgi:hypothetical protein